MSMDSILVRALPVFSLALFVCAVSIGTFTGGIWASLGIGGALIMVLAVWRIERHVPWPERDTALLAFLALGVMGVLNIASSQPDLSWHTWVRLATIFLPLLLLTSHSVQAHAFRPEQLNIVFIIAALSVLALSVELFLGGPLLLALKSHVSLTEYNRGLSYVVILAFPLMARLKQQARLAAIAAFVLILLIPASLTESRAAKLALLLALVTTFLAHIWPMLMRRVLMVLPPLLLAWPFVVQQFFLTHYDALQRFPDSWRARIEIWDYMSYRLMERPLFGWGLGTSHTLPFQDPHGARYVFTTEAAPHPHNVVIQLWVELGLPGLVLGLAFAFLMLKKAERLDPQIAPFAFGAWVAALCLSLVAYNFWTDSLFAAFAMTGFMFAILNRKQA